MNYISLKLKKVARRVAFKQEKYSASDFVALTQYKRIQENKIDNSQLLTEEDIRAKGLFLARDAKSFYNKENPSDIEKPVYDWASVQFYKYNNILEMPIKDYYTNEPILNEQERNFPKYDAFIESLKAKKYKLDVTTKIYAQADDVVIDRKNILISDESLSNTEIAVSAMYKLNKKALTKKRLFIFDDSYREAKKFFYL